MRRLSGFSLMEMMIVLLIVAIVAAASAPMINKKMLSQAGEKSPWIWTNLNNSIGYNIDNNVDQTASIGSLSPLGNARLYIETRQNNAGSRFLPQIVLGRVGPGGSTLAMRITSARGNFWATTNDMPTSDSLINTIAIGNNARVDNTAVSGIAIGSSSNANAMGSMSIGSRTRATGINAIAIGTGNDVGDGGATTQATNRNSIAIGQAVHATGNDSIAIGSADSRDEEARPTRATVNNAIAIGCMAEATADSAVAIGPATNASNNQAIAFGYAANATGVRSIMLGATLFDDGGANATATDSIAIGTAARATSANAIAIGRGAVSSNASSIAFGRGANTIGESGTAIGRTASAVWRATALGAASNASGIGSTAIGYNAKVTASNSVAIGAGANATESHTIVIGTKDDTVIIPGKIQFANLTLTGNLVVEGNTLLGGNNGSSTYVRENRDHYRRIMKFKDTYSNVDLAGSNDKIRGFDMGTTDAITINDKTYTSDRRLKNVGKAFKGGLAEVRKLQVFNYTFKDDKGKTPRVGVMAQDLQKVFPKAVTKGDDGFLRIRMEDMFYALINAVKENDNRISELEKQNKELLKRIEALEKKK